MTRKPSTVDYFEELIVISHSAMPIVRYCG